MLAHQAKSIFDHISGKSKKILLVPHANPDGDALGASTAFVGFLENQGIEYKYACATGPTHRYPFLRHLDQLESLEVIWNSFDFDTLIVFDSGDLRYAGVAPLLEKYPKDVTIINIDHHNTNEEFGKYNLVQKGASSTCELVYKFLAENGATITSAMATSLLTGIITDTDNFRNSATSASAMEVSGKLIAIGGKYQTIKSHVYEDIPVRAFGLWAKVLNRLEKHPELDFVYTYITQGDLKMHNLTELETVEFANFLNSIHQTSAALILHEKEGGEIKGSLRTTKDHIDVSAVAKYLGGGGHKKAAGFSLKMTMAEAIAEVTKAIHIAEPQLVAVIK